MKIRKKPVRIVIAAALLALASVIYAVCYSNVEIHYDDGSVQSCGSFCTFRGGWLCA